VLGLITSNLILYPVIGILMGYWFHLQPDIMIGIILLCFAPSPVVAALWTELSGGDGTISVTTALFSMMLSIIVYPVVLFFMGITSPDLSISIFKLLVLSIFVPAVIALFLRLEKEKYIPAKNTITLMSSFVGLFIIVVAIAHMASKVLANELNIIIIISLIVVVLLAAGFIYGHILSGILGVQKEYGTGFLYTSSMRDGIIPLSVGITYFNSYATMPATILLIVMPFMVVGVYYLVRK
jgi:BASS family bile acid:Na+ symporter